MEHSCFIMLKKYNYKYLKDCFNGWAFNVEGFYRLFFYIYIYLYMHLEHVMILENFFYCWNDLLYLIHVQGDGIDIFFSFVDLNLRGMSQNFGAKLAIKRQFVCHKLNLLIIWFYHEILGTGFKILAIHVLRIICCNN